MKSIKKKENKMTKTNLEHYKEQLKKIYNEYYDEPSDILDEIQSKIDSRIEVSDYSTYTDDILNWMSQPYKEPILDDAEREYLSAVIKPFRKKVMDVVKIQYSGERQAIRIRISCGDCTELPFFKNNTMYKGMEVGKYYTPEELGL